MDNKKLRPIMFVGTGSDVGKSIINAGFCRIFLQDGYQPAPFKAQNMSTISFPTKEGLELAGAQVLQAMACDLECTIEMNPILLKPSTNTHSLLVINGKVVGERSASEYFEKTDRTELFTYIKDAFNKLKSKYNPIVLEGAGSISEINLWDKDIVNMRMALFADAAVYLIADIDKGGVFGSVYGSILLLPENERKLLKGIIINKFRGDMELFREGRKMMEELTGIPVSGVIPYSSNIADKCYLTQDTFRTVDSKTKQNIAYSPANEKYFNRLANLIRENTDMDSIYKSLKLE